MNIESAVGEYRAFRVKKGLTASVLTKLDYGLSKLDPGLCLHELTRSDIVSLSRELRRADGSPFSPATLETFHREWRRFFKWCKKRGYTDKNLGKTLPRYKFVSNKKLDIEGIRLIRSNLEDYSRGFGPHYIRDAAAVSFISETGCRRIAAHNLLLVDVLEALETPDRDGVYTITTLSKGTKYVTLYFTSVTASFLRRYIRRRPLTLSPYLFVNNRGTDRVSKGTIKYAFIRLSKYCGLKKAIFPHAFRHAALSELSDLDVPDTTVQLVANHASVTTTVEHYIERRKSRRRKAAAKLRLVNLS